jgi:CrcB protein
MTTAFVAVAGAFGAVVRYRIGVAVGVRVFPWATLAINVSGCFALAVVLSGPWAARWSASTTTAIGVGFLGAYTTFSAFGYEAFTLVRTGRAPAALAYVVMSIVGGLAATALGYAAGRAA